MFTRHFRDMGRPNEDMTEVIKRFKEDVDELKLKNDMNTTKYDNLRSKIDARRQLCGQVDNADEEEAEVEAARQGLHLKTAQLIAKVLKVDEHL